VVFGFSHRGGTPSSGATTHGGGFTGLGTFAPEHLSTAIPAKQIKRRIFFMVYCGAIFAV
jgi:hypothetical protein